MLEILPLCYAALFKNFPYYTQYFIPLFPYVLLLNLHLMGKLKKSLLFTEKTDWPTLIEQSAT